MQHLILALLLGAFAFTARAEFLQKSVQQIALTDARLPAAVLNEAAAKPWVHAKRGPVPDLQVFAVESGGATWLGGPEGAARFDPRARHAWDRWQFFAGPRWLQDNFVR